MVTTTDPSLACWIADQCRLDPRCGMHATCLDVEARQHDDTETSPTGPMVTHRDPDDGYAQ